MTLKEWFCGFANNTLNCDVVLEEKLKTMERDQKYLENLIKDKETANKECGSALTDCANERLELQSKLDYCQLSLANCLNAENEQEKFWNNKYPKQNISYKRKEHDNWYEIDVRNYFEPFDFHLPIVAGASNDEKALKALELVRQIMVYVIDKTEYGLDEFWARAYQTLVHKKGDCEDGAILLANIMLKSEIPYWRIRLNAGDVEGGGHAYVTYCRETDNQFVVLDWCYWPKTTLIKDRPLHKDEQNYYGIWFSWNQKFSFGKMETMKGMPNNFIPRGVTNGKKR